MRSASNALTEHLNSGQQFLVADLYTFTLVGGFVARYTGAEGSLTVGGNTFDGGSLIITRSRTRTVIGVEVDTLDLTIEALSTHLLNGTSWLQAMRGGALDGASVKLERLFMPTWGDTSLGTLLLFAGRVADMEVGRFSARLRVNSDLELLNVQMPRNLYQPGCLNTLFDGACGLTKSAFGIAGTVTSATLTQINCGLAQVAGYFDLGTITFNSGANVGVSRAVKQYQPGVFGLALPLLAAPAAGDTFTAYSGCNKRQDTCQSKFTNGANFRGFPYIPAPETVV